MKPLNLTVWICPNCGAANFPEKNCRCGQRYCPGQTVEPKPQQTKSEITMEKIQKKKYREPKSDNGLIRSYFFQKDKS